MQVTTILRALAPALLGLLVGTGADAQGQVYLHIGHVADVYNDTPTGQGLLPTAVAEAEIAAQHAHLATEDPGDLDGMRRHAGHVMHALDPTMSGGGPGLGYGVKRAASGAVLHMELAAAADSTSESFVLHARHISAALANVVAWTDEAIGAAQRLQSAATAMEAASLATRLDALCQAIVRGRDFDRDGLVGWQQGEGGLAQATQHMNLLKRGESLAR